MKSMNDISSRANSLPGRVQGFFAIIGRRSTRFFEHAGRYCELMWWVIKNYSNVRDSPRNQLLQLVQVGSDSIPIVIFVATFIGMVTSIQSAYQINAWIPQTVVGALVIKSVLLELVPLLTALVLAGKVGATITAELGSMRVTEQIDALEAMGYDSISFLVTPRIISAIIMFPLLVIFGDFLALLGGLFGAVVVAQVPRGVFIAGLRGSFEIWDAVFGLIKSLFFGYTITSIACYQGYYVQGGSAGVGKATMNTVVWTCLAVVVLDFLLASILL